MTNEERAVIAAAKAWAARMSEGLWDGVTRELLDMVEALEAAAAPDVRKVWINYHFTSPARSGEGSTNLTAGPDPFTAETVSYWQDYIASLLARKGVHGASVVIRTWVELEG